MELRPKPGRLQHSEPISLRNLKLFSYHIQQYGFRDFQRFLIGSNSEAVFRIGTRSYYGIHAWHQYWSGTASAAILPIPQMSAIKQLIIWAPDPQFIMDLGRWLRAQCSEFKLFDQINVSSILHYSDYTPGNDRICYIISPIITIFQRSNESKLNLKCYPDDVSLNDMESAVNKIINAPFGTFTEIDLYIAFGLDHLTVPPRERTGNEETMRNIIKERVDDTGKWLEPWLVFDERRMKHMGLQKLDIELYLDVDPDYDDMNDWDDWRSTMQFDWDEEARSKADKTAYTFDQVIEMYLKEQIRHWNSIGRKCISTKSNEDERVYTVTLSLRI